MEGELIKQGVDKYSGVPSFPSLKPPFSLLNSCFNDETYLFDYLEPNLPMKSYCNSEFSFPHIFLCVLPVHCLSLQYLSTLLDSKLNVLSPTGDHMIIAVRTPLAGKKNNRPNSNGLPSSDSFLTAKICNKFGVVSRVLISNSEAILISILHGAGMSIVPLAPVVRRWLLPFQAL